MQQISREQIDELNIAPVTFYKWLCDYHNEDHSYINPLKTRIPLKNSDYFNVMPCVFESLGMAGVKIVTRSDYRRQHNENSLDSNVILYDSNSLNSIAWMDGNLVTTARTASIAVYSSLHCTPPEKIRQIAFVGLGNIGTMVADILFEILDTPIHIKVYRYKDQAERFVERYKAKKNITFEIVDSYENLMKDCDLIYSAVTFIDGDFCGADLYKKGCTLVPIHMRGVNVNKSLYKNGKIKMYNVSHYCSAA